MNTVEPIAGELFRFHVRSRSRPGEAWLVDIEENRCACENFTFRIAPKLDRGEPVERCWHLQQAREFFVDAIIELWSEKESIGQAGRRMAGNFIDELT